MTNREVSTDAAEVLSCCPLSGVTALAVREAHSRMLSCFRLQVFIMAFLGKHWGTLAIDLQMDIILLQTIRLSEQGLQLLLLLLQYREKKWRKL